MKLTSDEDRPTSWDEMDSSEVALIGDVPRLPLRVIAPADGEPLRMRRDLAAPRANGSGCVVLICAAIGALAVVAKLLWGGP